MGTTPNYGLRKPTDPEEPADFITIVGALADDTDSTMKRELDAKSGNGHTHNYSDPSHGHNYSVPGHGHDYAASGHGHNYADPGHGHNPSASGFSTFTHNFGSLSAGQQKSQRFGRSNDQFPQVTVLHASTYIIANVSSLDDGGYTVEVRNSTSSTNHTNVNVIVTLVRAA